MPMKYNKTFDCKSCRYVVIRPADIICGTIFSQIKRMNWTNKKIWRIAFPIILSSMKSEKLPIREVLRADYRMMEKTKDLMRRMKEHGLIAKEFDEDTANDLIFSALFYHTSLYIYSDDETFDEVLSLIRKNIEFIFKNDGSKFRLSVQQGSKGYPSMLFQT